MVVKKSISRTESNSFLLKKSYNLALFFRGIVQLLDQVKRIGVQRYIKIRRTHVSPSQTLGMVAILKDEATYIDEWIQYHRNLGFEVFFLYDNESRDCIKEVLDPYIKSGLVKYTYLPGKNMQERAYLDAVKKSKSSIGWLLTLDIDEFLEPVSSVDLLEWLDSQEESTSQIEIGWMVYGSSGHITRPDGLVIENYLHHAQDSFVADYKPIVRPERVLDMKFPHYYIVVGRTVNELGRRLWYYPLCRLRGAQAAPRKKFRINHYYSKSLDEFKLKSARGDAFNADRIPRNIKDFTEHDRNEVFDDSMLVFAEKIKHDR